MTLPSTVTVDRVASLPQEVSRVRSTTLDSPPFWSLLRLRDDSGFQPVNMVGNCVRIFTHTKPPGEEEGMLHRDTHTHKHIHVHKYNEISPRSICKVRKLSVIQTKCSPLTVLLMKTKLIQNNLSPTFLSFFMNKKKQDTTCENTYPSLGTLDRGSEGEE